MDMIQAMIEKEYIKEREGKSSSSATNENASSTRRPNKFSSD
jgi:hypothetical protein